MERFRHAHEDRSVVYAGASGAPGGARAQDPGQQLRERGKGVLLLDQERLQPDLPVLDGLLLLPWKKTARFEENRISYIAASRNPENMHIVGVL